MIIIFQSQRNGVQKDFRLQVSEGIDLRKESHEMLSGLGRRELYNYTARTISERLRNKQLKPKVFPNWVITQFV